MWIGDYRETQVTTKLLIPGLWNSGPAHWQSHWETLPGFRRVHQRDWETPRREDWISELDRMVMSLDFDVTLVAHSLGCATVAHWSQTYPSHAKRIQSALLAAPSDVDAASFPAGPHGFAPMPLKRLPFRCTVLCSTNDPYVSLERAELFARSWGSELFTMRNLGHMNGESHLGMWPDGMRFLRKLEEGAAEKNPGNVRCR